MKIIGRSEEIQILTRFLDSKRPEFMAMYGRRRVGKTFLIRQFFSQSKNVHFFVATGIKNGSFEQQKKAFVDCISNTFYQGLNLEIPESWHDIFTLLNKAIKKKSSKNKFVIFIDELPWLNTAKSGLLKHLAYFWNQYWSMQENIKLVICGSLASWVIKKIIKNTGDFYQRVTYRFHLLPFNIQQTQEFLSYNNINLNKNHLLLIYFVTGGIPLYLNQLRPGQSSTQFIDSVCFDINGMLKNEVEELFKTLFKKSELYLKIVRKISEFQHGLRREDVIEKLSLKDNQQLTSILGDLEHGGFLLKLTPFGHKSRGIYFKVVDEYTLFYFRWIEKFKNSISLKINNYWESILNTGEFFNWRGLVFEMYCLKHSDLIISGLKLPKGTRAYTWHHQGLSQIDLLFDRPDDAITLCEIKFTNSPYVISKEYFDILKKRAEHFVKVTKTKKTIFQCFISIHGLKKNKYSEEIFQSTFEM